MAGAAFQRELATKNFAVPESCPFSIDCLRDFDGSRSSLWLIRENDRFGEYPHIYAKIITDQRAHGRNGVIVLSDTGCATEKHNSQAHDSDHHTSHPQPRKWNLRTFLEHTINPGDHLNYVVISTHCHYDHIMGLANLIQPSTIDPPTLESTTSEGPSPSNKPGGKVYIVASAQGRDFISPYEILQCHSLCEDEGVPAPHYTITTWADDFEQLAFKDDSLHLPLDITIIHTPGHTPDSLSWYDTTHHLLCVADSFYSKESTWTRNARWGPEVPAPIYFNRNSVLADWWAQMDRLLEFVRKENHKLEQQFAESTADNARASDEIEPTSLGPDEWNIVAHPVPRVKIAGGHTMCDVDAEETIEAVKVFLDAVVRGEVPSEKKGQRILFDYAIEGKGGEYSAIVPVKVLEEGRKVVFV